MNPILNRLKRLFRRPGKSSVIVAGLNIQGLRPIRQPHAGSAVNKAGRLVLVGTLEGRRVKVYEAASASQAEFITAVANSTLAPGCLPAVLAQSSSFIVCRWAKGTPPSRRHLSSGGLQKLAQLQAAIHSMDVSRLPDPRFDYWQDIIVPRFIRAAALVGHEASAARIIERVERWRGDYPVTLNHPDLTLDNVIVNDRGELSPVDNELLYRGAGAFMDVINTMNSLPAKWRSPYIRAYADTPAAKPLPDPEVLRAFWLARRAGTLFIAGEALSLSTLFAGLENGRLTPASSIFACT